MRVLIATDGSPAALTAAASAGELLGPGTEWIVVSVVRPQEEPMADATGFAGPVLTPEQIEHEHTADVVAAHAALAATARELGPVPATQVVVTGVDTADTIVRAAHEHDVDLVVVGHSTDEGLTGLLRREIAPQLVTAAGRPVLVIPVSVDVESTAGAVA